MTEFARIKSIITSLIKETREISNELASLKARSSRHYTISDTCFDIAFTCPCCGNTIIQMDVPSDSNEFISFECDKCNIPMEWLSTSRSDYRNTIWGFSMSIPKRTQ